MHRLVTPLLRRVYALFGAFVLVYAAFLAFQYSPWNKERLYRKLLGGDASAKASAGFDLAYLNAELQLVRALKSHSPSVREVAMNALWDLWSRTAGHEAFRQVRAASEAMDRQKLSEALTILDRVIERHPQFPEGWNRRATLNWQMGRFRHAILDAQRAVALNPNHFGAWQGMALCHMHLGNAEEACRCLRKALQITPHDPSLREFLRRCEEVLRLRSPPEGSTNGVLLVFL